jgi:hypothetical protein
MDPGYYGCHSAIYTAAGCSTARSTAGTSDPERRASTSATGQPSRGKMQEEQVEARELPASTERQTSFFPV